jgi:hypothetical protein
MLNVQTMQTLLRITSRLDFTPVIDVLKDADIFTDAKDKKEAIQQITSEKAGELAVTAISALLPQLDAVADFLPELVARYKDISIEDAAKVDAFEVIDELIHDEGMTSFFKRALRGKAKQKLAGS